MEKKFKCQSCGHEFMADSSRFITCPQCQSDNIAQKQSGPSLTAIITIAVIALAIIAGAIVAYKYFHKPGTAEEYIAEPVVVQEDPEVDKGPTEAEKQALDDISANMDIAITFGAPTPVYNASTGTYSITIKANIENADADKYKLRYTAMTLSGEVIGTNDTGAFSGLKPIASKDNPDAAYKFKAEAMEGDKVVAENVTTVTDFKVQSAQPIEKMTKAELQTIVNTKDKKRLNDPRLSSAIAVTFSGQSQYPEGSSKPKDLSKLVSDYYMLDDIKSVIIDDISYDPQTNKVIKVVVTTTIEQ